MNLADRKRQVVVDELTEAALQLMAVKGFGVTTVDDIVAATGVSRRTFFRYSRGKALSVVRLVLVRPSLLARFLERQSQWQSMLSDALTARGAEAFRADLAAGTALAAFLTVLRRWSAPGSTADPVALLDQAFAQIGPAL